MTNVIYMESIRAFIAIELSDDIKKELEEIEFFLKSRNSTPAKWVNPESIHLTLKFLGDVSPEKITDISGAIKNGVTGITAFHLQLAGLGVFPNSTRVQVVWAGVTGDMDRLKKLQKNIEEAMEKQGFPLEKRNFSPHLTLARVRDYATLDERKQLGNLITDTSFSGSILKVDSVNLIKSQLTRQGAIYTRLSSIRLG